MNLWCLVAQIELTEPKVTSCTSWTAWTQGVFLPCTQGVFLHKLNYLNPRCLLAKISTTVYVRKVSSFTSSTRWIFGIRLYYSWTTCTHGVFLHNLNYLNPRCLNPWCLLHKKTWYPLALWIKWTHGFFLHKLNNMSPWYPVVHIEQNEPMSVFFAQV